MVVCVINLADFTAKVESTVGWYLKPTWFRREELLDLVDDHERRTQLQMKQQLEQARDALVKAAEGLAAGLGPASVESPRAPAEPPRERILTPHAPPALESPCGTEGCAPHRRW